MKPENLNQPLLRDFQVPVYLYLTVPLAVLATFLEMATPWCPGQIGFVLMLLPTLMAAFDGGYRSGFITGLAGALCLVSAAWFAMWAHGGGRLQFVPAVIPVVWGVALVGCGYWLGRCLDIVRQRADLLQDRCDQHERSIYQLYKDSSEVAAAAEQERLRRQQEEAQRLDFSRLLLNIQHLGRELSGRLEMNAVFSLVTETAKKLLKAPNPRLFLLDEQSLELVEHTPGSEGQRLPTDRGMMGWTIRHRQIITAEDVAKNHALADLQGQDPVKWHACAPLVFGEYVLGVLGIDAVDQKSPEFDRLLYIVANFSAVAVNNGQMFQRAEETARRDGLTGLLNHATFQSRLAESLSEARKNGSSLSIVIADVDQFKQFNDRHGHQAGDFVLRSVASLLERHIPERAIAARYGGEEFVCVLPGSDMGDATQQAESLRFALEQEELEFEGTSLRVTASFGVATFPQSADSPAGLIREADSAMYAAKRSGRNRVCAACMNHKDDAVVHTAGQLATA